MDGVFLLFFGGAGVKGWDRGKWLKKMRARQEVRKWMIGGKEEEDLVMGKRPADLSLTPPPVSDPPPVLVSREDEFSGRLSSRAGFRGCTALHYATLADDPHLVRTLLEAGRFPTPPPYSLAPPPYA